MGWPIYPTYTERIGLTSRNFSPRTGAGVPGVTLFESIALASPQLQALNTTSLPNGTEVFVLSVFDSFNYDANSVLPADGITIVQPLVGPGRFIRQNIASIKWQRQTVWFMDVAGIDENDGLTALTPIRTMGELSRRINNGSIIANTLVTLTAGVFGPLNLTLSIEAGVTFELRGVLTQTAAGTLSAVTNTDAVTSTRGAVTNTGGDPAFTVNSRLRLTGGANIGALAYSSRVIAANQVNVTPWATINPLVDEQPVIVNAAINDTYVVETRATTIGAQNINIHNRGRFLYRQLILSSSTIQRTINTRDGGGGIFFYDCQINAGGGFEQSQVVACSCQVGGLQHAESVFKWEACYFTGFHTVFAGSTSHFYVANAFKNATISNGGLVIFRANTQFIDIASSFAILSIAGSYIQVGSEAGGEPVAILWGANNAITSAAIGIRSLAGLSYEATATLNIPGGVADTIIGGTATAYGLLPFNNVANQAAIVVRA